MTKKKPVPLKEAETQCPVARAQSIVGDRWTVLVLRELFLGNRRFEEIQVQTEATPQMLATRLKKMEVEGLVERRLYSERPPRHEYCLTKMGLSLHPILLAMSAWGEVWCKSEAEERAINYIHNPCGQDPGLGPTCQVCGGVLRREDLSARLSAPFKAEREAKRNAFRERRD